MRKSHPWRRCDQFVTYLAKLPPEERRRIEAAERQFVAEREAPSSTYRRTLKTFDTVMVGINEHRPFYLTR